MNVYTRLIVGLGVPAADVPVVLEVMRAEHRTLDGLGPHQFKRAVQKAQADARISRWPGHQDQVPGDRNPRAAGPC